MNGIHSQFFGNLTRDPEELRYAANTGNAYLHVTVAVNDYRGPDQDQDTYFVRTTLFGPNAERAMNRCRKGTRVFVQGKYRFREYQRNDGSKGYSHELTAREFEIVSQPAGNGQAPAVPEPEEEPESDAPVMEPEDLEDPVAVQAAEEGVPFGDQG